jgi:hypothetical protein
MIILDMDANLINQLNLTRTSRDTYIAPPVVVGTLLNPTTPLVGFASSALLFKERLTASATTSGPSSTIGAASAVVRGRTSGGVLVIASGPSCTAVIVFDRIGVGTTEFVIKMEEDDGIVPGGMDEMGRVVVLERVVLLDERFESVEAGDFDGLDNCPRSLKGKRKSYIRKFTHPARAMN